MGASLALAGASGCITGPPSEQIVSPPRAEPRLTPGQSKAFATAITRGGYAHGVLAQSRMGRPIKLEGNPDHPQSLGATDPITQAALLEFYDPDRSQVVLNERHISTWQAFARDMASSLEPIKRNRGRGLRFLTGATSSPTFIALMDDLLRAYPEARWHQYEPVSDQNQRAGASIAFNRPYGQVLHVEQADVIVSFGCDFLMRLPGSVRYAREFSNRRRVRHSPSGPERGMNRLYVAETSFSVTGANADHRLPARSRDLERIALAVAANAGLQVQAPATMPSEQRKWAEVVARDLLSHRGTGLVLAGESQPPAIHALVHALNEKLGNVGKTVTLVDDAVAVRSGTMQSLRELVEAMGRNEVELLVLIDVNPVYDAPVDLPFAQLMSKVRRTVHMGLYHDETAQKSHWHLPLAHNLESWGDARAFDGTVTILQPLIQPLYQGRSALELLSLLRGTPVESSREAVRANWARTWDAASFEVEWRSALRRGVVANSQFSTVPATVLFDRVSAAVGQLSAQPSEGAESLELVLEPDPTIWDGRYANNGWLQELPKQLSNLTWDHAAIMGRQTASRFGVRDEDMIEIRYGGRSLRAPVWIVPGTAEGAIVLSLGYGRWAAGRVGNHRGVNAYQLRHADSPWLVRAVEVRKTQGRYALATRQSSQRMHGRELVRAETEPRFRASVHELEQHQHKERRHLTMYADTPKQGQQWGMSIDLSTCIGCGACTIACQAENNIPVVGKEQVQAGRIMHWIRVDRYFEGDPSSPRTAHQPVPCMQCENAPCEVVCPTAATQHSKDGLNDMVYNRCIGTRYCSNNCPYKVRRFNFLLYADQKTGSLKLLRNPEVTVRSRGVMEKCTYCVQRIREAQIDATKQNKPIADGAVQTACQQVCPTRAIIFGDVSDDSTQVSRAKREPHDYWLLAELNTRPRTSYLMRVENPNAELDKKR